MNAPLRPERRRWPAYLRSWTLNLLLLLALIAALDWYRAPDAHAVEVARLATTQGEPVDFQAQRQPTVLYVWAEWCGYCRLARGYLARNGIAYREIDIDTPDGKAAFAEIGGRGVPVLLADGQRLAGFRESSYDALFANRKAAAGKK